MTYSNLTTIWQHTVMKCVHSQVQPSRNGDCKEIYDFDVFLEDINQNFVVDEIRAADPGYAAAELLWYASETENVGMLLNYAPSYAKFAEANGCTYGAYGPRIMPKLREIIWLLRKFPYTRQAVISVWNPVDLFMAHKVRDMPCTVSLQFLLRGGKLNCTTYMRSNDVWLGMPYDIFAFTMLQRLVADELGVRYGWYRHVVGSMHLYATNYAAAEKVQVSNQYAYEHNWDNRFRIDDLANAVTIESEIRKGKTYTFYPGSASSDLLVCCDDKLNLSGVTPCSPLLKEAMRIRWQERNKAKMVK